VVDACCCREITIGENAFVAAGTVVTQDVADRNDCRGQSVASDRDSADEEIILTVIAARSNIDGGNLYLPNFNKMGDTARLSKHSLLSC